MSRENQTVVVSGGGVGFLGLLALLFIGLKLTGFINWSWLWVLAPLWIPTAIVLAIIAIALIALAGVGLVMLAFWAGRKISGK